MNLVSKLVFTTLVLSCPLVITAQRPGGATSGGRIQISRTRVAQAIVDGVEYDIFPETQNLDNPKAPNVWRFDVQPLFVFKRRESSSLEVNSPRLIDIVETRYSTESVEVKGGHRNDVITRLILTLVVNSKEQTDKAVEALNALYKTQGFLFTASQISTIPVIQADLDFKDLTKKSPCNLINSPIKLSGSEPSVEVYFDCLDNPPHITAVQLHNVEEFKRHLPYMIASIKITYDAQEADRASVNVQSTDIRKSTFYADLAGKGDSVYVSRNDLRKLGIEASKDLSYAVRGRKMTADELATCTTPQMMSFPEVTIDWAQVSAQTLSNTYNGNDLSPTQVNKELSELVDKSSSEDDVQISTGGKVSAVWGLGSAEGHLDGKTFQKRAAEHGLKVEWDGKKWSAKGLDVHQVNLNDLAERISRSCVFETYGEGTQRAMQERQLKLR